MSGGEACLLGRDGPPLFEEGKGSDNGILFQSQNEFIPPAQRNVGPVCQVRGFVDGAENKAFSILGKNGAEASFCHDDATTAERLPGSGKRMCHGKISVIFMKR